MSACRFIRVCEAAGVASARSGFMPDETMQYAIMKQRMITAVTMKLIDCKATTGPVVEWLAGSSITGALEICGKHVSLTITAVCFSGGDGPRRRLGQRLRWSAKLRRISSTPL